MILTDTQLQSLSSIARVMSAAVLRTVTGEDFGQVQPTTPLEAREAVADRYRVLYESARAAQGR